MTEPRLDIKFSNYAHIDIELVIAAAKKGLQAEMFEVERTSKKDYLTGPRPEKLGVVTGNLRSAVKGTVIERINKLIGKVGVGPHVWYGKVHEEGINGMKKRPFLQTAIEDHIESMSKNIMNVMDVELEDQI